MTKLEFIDHIFQQNWLWSYNPQAKDQLSDTIIIEHSLLFGDVEDLQLLFVLYDDSDIRATWLERLVPQTRYRKLNTYLAKFFFHIDNADEFINNHIIEYPRLEQFRLL